MLAAAPEFWQAAGYIDVNGPHHVHELDSREQDKLNAIWAWNADQPRASRITEPTDVTEKIHEWKNAIENAIYYETEMIQRGEEWSKEVTKKVESCLYEENKNTRSFVTQDVFCSSSYYSPNENRVFPNTVVFNEKFKAITVANSDGSLNAKEFMQSMYGPDAGGHPGIAGTPRGKEMTIEDFKNTIQAVEKFCERQQRLDKVLEKTRTSEPSAIERER